MVTGKAGPIVRRVTLRQAHELLSREWPGLNASVAAQVAHHERAAVLYEQVARVDADHHHEALYWAGYVRELIQELRSAAGASDGAKGGAS